MLRRSNRTGSHNDRHRVARALTAHGDDLRLAAAAQWVEAHAVALLVEVAGQRDTQLQELAPRQPHSNNEYCVQMP